MRRFYVACDLREDSGRVVLGALHGAEFALSEVHRFPIAPVKEKKSLHWDVAQIYQEVLAGLRTIGSYEEAVASISCTSWGSDYMLVEKNGALITPTYHREDPRAASSMKQVLAKIPGEALYGETGIQSSPGNTLFQLQAESSRRLHHAAHLLPFADGFNYLWSGVPRVEMSQASATQLFNPGSKAWSPKLLATLRLPANLFPTVVPAGTGLGELNPKICQETRLDDVRVISSCSHELAAALAGLPLNKDENWAFLRPGSETLIGTQIKDPLIANWARESGFSHLSTYDGQVAFHKQAVGLRILEECQRFWRATDREMDTELLLHLAGSATPFESLIDPSDPRFLDPEDTPLKIQAFCKETNQAVPRKPGPIFRCILESLALYYRRLFIELEQLTGSRFDRLFVLDGSANSLLNHFTANALQLPAVVLHGESAPVGNILVQALSLKHIPSVEEGRDIVRHSIKAEMIAPFTAAWDIVYERWLALTERAGAQNTQAAPASAT